VARDFTRASSEFLEASTTPVTGYPVTLSCWFNADDITGQHVLFGIFDTGATNADAIYLEATGNAAGDPVRATSAQNNGFSSASTSTGFSASTWNHAAGVFSSATSRDAYLNGGGKASNATSRTPSGLSRILVSRFKSNAVDVYSDCQIAEAAIWDVALSDEEIASLAKGVSPLLVRPASLVFYAPIFGTQSPEPEIVGARDLTVTGTSKSAHPRIFRPTAKILAFPSASAGSLNVSATTDALTLAEYAATIGKSKNVSANVDALILAEYAATVSLSRNVSANVDALTLAEYSATIGKSLNISAGTDALTLAEYAASVGSVTDIATTTDALTLAEYAATIGLSKNVQAGPDALTLAEYPASLGSTTNVEATTDALTLVEYPATVSFALNVSATTDALTLAEYQATISDGSAPVVSQNPSTGGGRVYRPGRVYAPVASPKKKKKADIEAVSKASQKAPESPTEPYTVAGNLGAITKEPIVEPVKTAQIIPIRDYVEKSTLDSIIQDAIRKAKDQFEQSEAEKKVLDRLEKEESFLSWEETESLLLLAMVD
jgi:hypothetical protein